MILQIIAKLLAKRMKSLFTSIIWPSQFAVLQYRNIFDYYNKINGTVNRFKKKNMEVVMLKPLNKMDRFYNSIMRSHPQSDLSILVWDQDNEIPSFFFTDVVGLFPVTLLIYLYLLHFPHTHTQKLQYIMQTMTIASLKVLISKFIPDIVHA